MRHNGDLTDSGFFGSEVGDGAEALDPAVVDLVDELLAEAPPGREGLLRVLLGLQNAFDRVSGRMQVLVADRFGLSPAQVAGVVSYFPKLSGRHRRGPGLEVCTGPGRFLSGGEWILGQVAGEASELPASAGEPLLAIRQDQCLDVCGLAPVVRTDGRIRPIRAPGELDELVDSLLGTGADGEDDS